MVSISLVFCESVVAQTHFGAWHCKQHIDSMSDEKTPYIIVFGPNNSQLNMWISRGLNYYYVNCTFTVDSVLDHDTPIYRVDKRRPINLSKFSVETSKSLKAWQWSLSFLYMPEEDNFQMTEFLNPMKKGNTMRFRYYTWPGHETKEVVFSLIGFTKAYNWLVNANGIK
jgi:hypothetical protein